MMFAIEPHKEMFARTTPQRDHVRTG